MFSPTLVKYRDRDLLNKGCKRDARRAEGQDVLPTREKMRVGSTRRVYTGGYHQIRRWLTNQIGRPWNDVHSELCGMTGKDTMERLHLMRAVDSMVDVQVEEIDGVLYRVDGCQQWKVHPGDFYVRDGILCRLARAKAIKPTPALAVTFTGQMEAVGISNGQWFALSFAALVLDVGYDVFLRRHIGSYDCMLAYGKNVYAVSKRAMSKREIRAFKAAR